MQPRPPTTGTAGTPDPSGVVCGTLLRVIRDRLGLTQEQLAEALTVDANTVKGWETGRRPLARVSVQTLRALMRTLTRLGADPALLAQLDTAIDVDLFVGHILTGPDTDHPLASWVSTRGWSDLLAWALAGTPPAAVGNGRVEIPRPRLSVPDRARFFDRLRTAAEQADVDDPAAVLLRRQTFFVVAWDPESRDWLAARERREERRLRRGDGWTPQWVAARSLAVARACQGDPEQLRRFIAEQLRDDRAEAANLNYWAYWIGEHQAPAVSDDFMAAGGDLGPWRGGPLLRHLTAGLRSGNPYVELSVHSVWALLARRPWLLDDQPDTAEALRYRVEQLLDVDDLTPQARRELNQIHYMTVAVRGTRR